MVLCFCLIVFKIPINIAVGAVELDGVGAAGRFKRLGHLYPLSDAKGLYSFTTLSVNVFPSSNTAFIRYMPFGRSPKRISLVL